MWLLLLLLTWLIGYLYLSFWKNSFFLLEKLFLSFVVGIASVSFLTFLLGMISLPLTRENILLSLLSICLILLFLLIGKWGNIFERYSLQKKRLSLTEMFFCLIIFFVVAWSFSQTVFWPPWEWDTLALYDYRARIIAQTHSLATSIFTSEPQLTAYNYVYTFSTSLMHALVYVGGGENPQFIYSLFYTSIIVLFYSCLRRKISRLMSLVLTTFLATTPSILYPSTIAYPNLAFATYLSFSTIYFWEWTRYKKVSYFLVSALFLSLSTWIRNSEPFWIVNIIFVAVYLLIFERKIRLLLIYYFLFFPLQQLWPFYQKSIFSSFPNTVLSPPAPFHLDFGKIPEVFYFVLQYFVKDWFGYLVLLFVAIVLFRKASFIKVFVLAWLLGYLGLAILGTYFFAVSFPWWNQVGGSAERVSVFFAPLLLYSVSLFWAVKDEKIIFPISKIEVILRYKRRKIKITDWARVLAKRE